MYGTGGMYGTGSMSGTGSRGEKDSEVESSPSLDELENVIYFITVSIKKPEITIFPEQ